MDIVICGKNSIQIIFNVVKMIQVKSCVLK